jgi:uncharacterized phage-like protein YoqJ
MKIGITGHRPQKLNSEWNYDGPVTAALAGKFQFAFETRKPDAVISGMAQGTDQIAADIALGMGIPVIAAIPFKTQSSTWSKKAKERYETLLNAPLTTVVNVDEVLGKEHVHYATKMQLRNEWIVDNCDGLIAVWNKQKDGGTYHCLCYARKRRRPTWLIDPRHFIPDYAQPIL